MATSLTLNSFQAIADWSDQNQLTGNINTANANSWRYNCGNVANGTGSQQCDLMYAVQFTIAGGGSSTTDLTSLTGFFGQAVNFAHVKFLYIELGDDTSSSAVTVGGGSTPFYPAGMPPVSNKGVLSFGALNGPGIATVVTSVSTTLRATASNIATITTGSATNLAIGQVVTVSGMTDGTYNGTFIVLSTPTATSFTYALTHANESPTADTAGTVANGSGKNVKITNNDPTNTATIRFFAGGTST